jgi:hypothetical protein
LACYCLAKGLAKQVGAKLNNNVHSVVLIRLSFYISEGDEDRNSTWGNKGKTIEGTYFFQLLPNPVSVTFFNYYYCRLNESLFAILFPIVV